MTLDELETDDITGSFSSFQNYYGHRSLGSRGFNTKILEVNFDRGTSICTGIMNVLFQIKMATTTVLT